MRHASRTGIFGYKPQGEYSERIVAKGCVTREQPAFRLGITRRKMG